MHSLAHDLNHGQEISQEILNNPNLQIGQSASPAASSSAPGPPDLPATSATNDEMGPAQALLSPFSTPSPPRAKPGRACSGALSASNTPQLPLQVHVAAPNTQHSSDPSSSRPDVSAAPQAANSASSPARYRSILSASSVSLLSGDNSSTSHTTPNVSPISKQRSEPMSSSPTVYTPSGENR